MVCIDRAHNSGKLGLVGTRISLFPPDLAHRARACDASVITSIQLVDISEHPHRMVSWNVTANSVAFRNVVAVRNKCVPAYVITPAKLEAATRCRALPCNARPGAEDMIRDVEGKRCRNDLCSIGRPPHRQFSWRVLQESKRRQQINRLQRVSLGRRLIPVSNMKLYR